MRFEFKLIKRISSMNQSGDLKATIIRFVVSWLVLMLWHLREIQWIRNWHKHNLNPSKSPSTTESIPQIKDIIFLSLIISMGSQWGWPHWSRTFEEIAWTGKRHLEQVKERFNNRHPTESGKWGWRFNSSYWSKTRTWSEKRDRRHKAFKPEETKRSQKRDRTLLAA